MTLRYYLLETDDDPGTGAETDQRDLPRDAITKALIFDVTAQTNGTAAGGRSALYAQIDQLTLGAAESNSVGQIDGEDLDAFNVLLGNHALVDTSASNNQRNTFGMTWPLDPFMIGPNMDFSQPFGITGSVARKIQFLYAADSAVDAGLQLDDKRMAIGIICKTDGASQGYVTFLRNAFTGATGGVATFTDVPQPGKLLGVHTFETTGAADITNDGDHRTTQSVRTESVTVGRKDVLGPIYTTTADAINGGFEIGAINDEGYSFWNLGFHNEVGPLGIPSGTATIPSDMEIRTNTGAADAIRVHAVTLNTNV